MLLPLLKALADPTRLRLVAILDRCECTVQELTEILQMGQSRISRHLKILLEAGILGVKRQGTWGYYRTRWDESLATDLWRVVADRVESLPGHREDLGRLAGILELRRRRSRDFFDRHARQWDLLAEQLLPTADYLPALAAMLPPCRDLLEIGVGTGRLLPALAAEGRRVTGVDQSPEMIAEARARVAAGGLEGQVELRLGEMTHLPVADRSTDCALLNMVLHHAPEPGAVFTEVGRVLRNDGQVLIVDLLRHEAEWTRERVADQWLGFMPPELETWLEKAGFASESYQELAGEEGCFAVFLLLARKIDTPIPDGIRRPERKETQP